MKERGIVSKIVSDQVAEVTFKRSAACEKCRACRIAGEGMVAIEAVNEVGAMYNDAVEIEFSTEAAITSSIVVFFLPILFMIAGYLIGNTLAERFALIFAFLALAISFIVITWYDRNIAKKGKASARIVQVVSGH